MKRSIVVAATLFASVPAVASAAPPAATIAVASTTLEAVLGAIVAGALKDPDSVTVATRQVATDERAVADVRDGTADLTVLSLEALDRVLALPPPGDEKARTSALKKAHLEVSAPFGLRVAAALAMPADPARRAGIETLDHLRDRPGLRASLSAGFAERKWPEVQRTYGLKAEVASRPAPSFPLPNEGEILFDVGPFETIDRNAYRILEDPRQALPVSDMVAVARATWVDKNESAWAAIDKVAHAFSDAIAAHLVRLAEQDKKSPDEVAQIFLGSLVWRRLQSEHPGEIKLSPDARPVADPYRHWRIIARLTRQHLFLVLAPLAVALAVAVPLGYLISRRRAPVEWILSVSSALSIIPSISLLAFLLPPLGAGVAPALATLLLSSLAVLVPATDQAFRRIPADLLDLARTLELSRWRRFHRMEWPLAAPAVLRAVRRTAVVNVGTATVAALFGAGGYGSLIVTGLALGDLSTVVRGAAPAALLAILLQWAFELLEWTVLPPSART